MQYETVILEMLSRIQSLEDRVNELEQKLNTANSELEQAVVSRTNTKVTDEMLDACYVSGKSVYINPNLDINLLADDVARNTGMNRSNAFMTITAVKALLDGELYKRTLSAKALDKYFNNILLDYGKPALAKAIDSIRQHISYLQGLGKSVDRLIVVCDKYKVKL